MNPVFTIKAGKFDVSAQIMDRFMSLTVTDEAGWTNDRFSLEIDDRPFADGSYLTVPKRGEEIEISIGYEYKLNHIPGHPPYKTGKYIIDEIEWTLVPQTIVFTGRASDTAGRYKDVRSNTWHRKTVSEILADCAQYCGYTASVDEAIGSIKIDHENQTLQSTAEFLRVFGQRVGAEAKVQDGKLLFAPVGKIPDTGKVADTAPIYIKVSDLTGAHYVSSGTSFYGEVRASWYDSEKRSGTVTAYRRSSNNAPDKVTEGDAKPIAIHGLTGTFPNALEAQRAADYRMAILQSSEAAFEFSTLGNAKILAGTLVHISDLRPGLIKEWRVGRVTHTFLKDGFLTRVECEIPKEESEQETDTNE